jgi:hypothetical protein
MATSSSVKIQAGPQTCLLLENPPQGGAMKYYSLPEDPIPNFDWKAIPPSCPGDTIDVSQRVEELHKYLKDNTYPDQRTNITAAIRMYNRKELPKPDSHIVYIQDGKLTELTIECIEREWDEPLWTEVSLKHPGQPA